MDHPIRGVNRPDRPTAASQILKMRNAQFPFFPFRTLGLWFIAWIIKWLVLFSDNRIFFSLPPSLLFCLYVGLGGIRRRILIFLWQSKCRYQLLFKCLNTFTLGQKNFASYTFLFLHSNTFKQHNSLFWEGAIFQKKIFINVWMLLKNLFLSSAIKIRSVLCCCSVASTHSPPNFEEKNQKISNDACKQ